jgi:RNA polymerase sigma-32 factor
MNSDNTKSNNSEKKIKIDNRAKSALVKSTGKDVKLYDPLDKYMKEMNRYRLLNREEEVILGKRIQEEGDQEAAYILITSNLRLVVKIALEFQRVWMNNLLDLIQEGNVGLLNAVQKFDPYKNVKFSYYASFWIKAYILKFIMDNWRLVKIGTTQGQRKLFFKLNKEKKRLMEQGFDPQPKLLAETLGVAEKEVIDMEQRLDNWDISLDAPAKEDSNTSLIDIFTAESESPEINFAKKELKDILLSKIKEIKKDFNPKDKDIFEERIFSDSPLTLQELGDRYNISRERIRQIEKNVINKITNRFKKDIPDFDKIA